MLSRSAIEPNAAPLLIRADANREIGSGHAMRCLALLQQWRDDGGRAARAFVPAFGDLSDRYDAEGVDRFIIDASPGSSADAAATVRVAKEIRADWVIVDGYRFDPEFTRSLQAAGLRVLRLDDDGHSCDDSADILLNQNIDADEAAYSGRGLRARLLIGTRYALLRREFRAWWSWSRATPNIASKLLVTLGGSDPENVTLEVMRGVDRIASVVLELKVVLGPSNPHRDTLERAAQCSFHRAEILSDVHDMPNLMAWADVAVSAAGSTCWELAFMGLPNLVFMLAENQRGNAAGLANAGVSLSTGLPGPNNQEWAGALEDLLHDPGRRDDLSERGRRLVDGLGAARVAAAVRGANA